MLVLAFDTATDVATSALVDDGSVLGERTSIPRTVLEDADALLREAGRSPADLDASSSGPAPAASRALASGSRSRAGWLCRSTCRVAGVSTLDVLAAGAPGALPVVDARRKEVFVPGPRAVAPRDLEVEPGTMCVGSGAVRYRAELEALGAVVPPDDDERHLPRARWHALLAVDFGAPDAVEPIYVRAPGRRGEGVKIELRALDERDLDALEQIERLSYPSPWSRAMFAAELQKPGGARARGVPRAERAHRVRHRLPVRRRLAPHERRGGARVPTAGNRGDAPRAAVRGHRRRPATGVHARGACLERRRDPALRAARLRGSGHSARRTTRTTARTR